MALRASLSEFIQTHGTAATYWVAYSGGLDSHVLLHLLADLRAEYFFNLHAVYVNHGVSQSAVAWGEHCARVCADLSIPFSKQQLSTSAIHDKSPEDDLRQRRYAVFAAMFAPNDFLLTAHHQDDQAETVLLQLLRGAGPKGLAAMPVLKTFSHGFHARPLLNFTRADLTHYAEQNKLVWIEDESNQDTQYTRNFLRHNVMPMLTTRWPTVTQTLARVAENCAEAQAFLESISSDFLTEMQGSLPQTLSLSRLRVLSTLKQKQILRAWIMQQQFPLPSAVKLQQALQDLLQARADKLPVITWRDAELRLYRDDLFLLNPVLVHDLHQEIHWDLTNDISVDGLGVLTAEPVNENGLTTQLKSLTIRFRQGGETIRLPGRMHHHDLKKLFQTWGVLPWVRDRVPLLYSGGQLVAVVGYAIADGFVANEGDAGWAIKIKSR